MRASVLFLGLVACRTAVAGSACKRREPAAGSPRSSVIANATISSVPAPYSTVPSSSKPATAVTVAPDAQNGQFTAVNDAILYAQNNGLPTVTVKAGTYTESVVIQATAAVTVVGETSNVESEADYTSNLVTISNTGLAVTFDTAAKGIAWRHIGFSNTNTTSTDGVVYLRGSENAFYGCKFICAGSVCITSSYAAGLIVDSYIEGADKLISSYASIYVYGSTITATNNNALLVYNKGVVSGSVQYNSTVVFDSCSVIQKPGSTNKNVYLAAANSLGGSVVVYRNTSLAGFISGTGAHVDTKTQTSPNMYIEFRTSGAGSYQNNAAVRLGFVNWVTDASQMKAYELSQFFANVYPIVATTDLSWIDSGTLQAMEDDDMRQDDNSSATASTSQPTATTAPSSSPSIAASTCVIPSSVPTTVLVVGPVGSCAKYSSVSAAVADLPLDSTAQAIYILSGTYTEQVWVNRTGKVSLFGETAFPNDFTQNTVTIQFRYGVLTSANEDETTPVINAKKTDGTGLALYNINFVNTNPQTANTAALAADFYGTSIAAYGCSFVGYQDTLLVNQGVQVFSNCYVEGSVDFIWGYSKAYFHQCYIAANTAGASISAQNRPSTSWAGGFVFDTCYVTYTSTYGSTLGKTYLGRPWSEYAVAVYMNSYLDEHINPAGWSVWSSSVPNTDGVLFGEYNNSGPGSWQDNAASRVAFATNLTAAEAASYTLSAFLDADINWIDAEAYAYTPSYNLSDSGTTTGSSPTTNTSATWAHPTSGTAPPAGAVLVSPKGAVQGSYANLTAALAALPDDATTQIIFVYPGTYEEQVPSVDRSGPVMIVGYTESDSPGSSYSANTVTISQSRGLSVSPVPAGHSDAETATFSTASTKISLYNINIINTANLDGAQASYVTLAASIDGNHIGFYGCSFIGWQDTLLTNTRTGYQYYESCYIEGAIDFIWGYSKAYFKGCTIGAKRAKSAITAQSRSSSSAVGGYVFDQCLFTAASNATEDLTQLVYLGRPYSSYALVVVKNSYLDSIIQPSGWKVWSTTQPNTDHITFAEYNNSGPGNWENNAAARVAWQNCTLLTSDTFPLSAVMDTTDWIDLTYWDRITTPQPAASPSTPANSSTTYNGTVPPAGAFVVCQTPVHGVTCYTTIQDALDVLPASSKTTAVVFIYPGVYEEQLVLNKSGTTIFMGYSNATDDYLQNQVTITYARGVDTGSDESNSDAATVYATGNYFQAININFANTFGTTEDYATLGFAVKSSKYASLYGCQVYGNQDALLINGYFFAYNSYIEGNVDMIWGSGAGYFLSSTIAPNEDGISLTADKRSTNTTAGGFVFDQCTIVPASGASFSEISLGRPWNNYARVAYIESNLGSCVMAAGWSQWSSSTPRTDGVLFGEYANYGAGASTAHRASFATQLTAEQAAQFELASFFALTSWINTTLIHVTPFTAGNATVSPVSTSGISTETAYTTAVTTAQETLTQTVTATGRMTTLQSTTTVDLDTTITPTLTTVVTVVTLSTTTVSTSAPTSTATKTTTTLVEVASTVTPVSTKTSQTTATEVDVVTATIMAKASTAKSTTTSTVWSTSTPKATTVTVSETSTAYVVSTRTPDTVSTTSTTTITTGSTKVITVKKKATTITETVKTTSTKTTTKTTSLTCIPTAAKKVRRAVSKDSPLSAAAVVDRRAVDEWTTTVDVYSTVTTDVTTTYVTVSGQTYTVDYATETTGTTKTANPTTYTVISTSVSTVYVTTAMPVVTVTVSTIVTETSLKITTLKASTTTVLVTVDITSSSTAKLTLPASTTTTWKTKTTKSTTVLPTTVITTTSWKTTTDKSTTTIPAATTTVWKTTTASLSASTVTVWPSTVTKTKTDKVATTVTRWVTKTSKGAAVCTD